MNASQANIWINVNIGLNVAVPGPLPIYATISNSAQPPPDFSLCDDASPPIGCGYYTVPTRAPRLSRMDIISMQTLLPIHDQGDELHAIVTYNNIGEGNATAMTMTFAVPPGFQYTSNSASPPLACDATGTPAAGQTLQCRYAASYPAGVTGTANLNFTVSPLRPTHRQ